MNIDDQVWCQVQDQVWWQAQRQVQDQVERQVWHWVRDQVLLKTQFNVWDHVIKKMRDDYK